MYRHYCFSAAIWQSNKVARVGGKNIGYFQLTCVNWDKKLLLGIPHIKVLRFSIFLVRRINALYWYKCTPVLRQLNSYEPGFLHILKSNLFRISFALSLYNSLS